MELVDFIHQSSTTNETWEKLHQNKSDLTELMVIPAGSDFDFPHPSRWGPALGDAKIAELGPDVGKNTRLKELALYSNWDDEFVPSMLHRRRLAPSPLSDEEIERKRHNFKLLCEGFQKNKSIEKLHLQGTMIQYLMQFLTPFLMEHTNVLKEISLVECELGNEDIQLLTHSLLTRGIPLEKLRLVAVQDGIEELVMAFHDNPGLFPKKFHATLSNPNRSISANECNKIAHLLQKKRCTMEELTIMPRDKKACVIIDDRIIAIAKALVGNETLFKLELGHFKPSRSLALDFIQTLCNTSTINNTYTSNHTLCELHDYNGIGNNIVQLSQYLDMNRNVDKKFVACQKVLRYHFFSDKFSMVQFEGMEPDLLMRSLFFLDKWVDVLDKASYVLARRSILLHLIKRYPDIVQAVPQTKVAHDTEISRPSKRIRASG
jgi:hypothetical protein